MRGRKRPTPNAQHPTPNVEDARSWTLGVGRWMLGVDFILSFKLIELIDIGRAVVAIHRDNERETDRRFSRRDRDRKNRHDHASRAMRLAAESPEGDEIQVRCRQHHLDSDQNEDGVSPT